MYASSMSASSTDASNSVEQICRGTGRARLAGTQTTLRPARDRTRPKTTMRHPVAPGRRPSQPSTPQRVSVSQMRRPMPATVGWQLSDSGLLVIILSFLILTVLSVAVIICQYLSVSTAPITDLTRAGMPVISVPR